MARLCTHLGALAFGMSLALHAAKQVVSLEGVELDDSGRNPTFLAF